MYSKILETVVPIDIRAAVGQSGEDATIKDKHLLITVVDVLKEKALKLGYDFCSYNGQLYFFNGEYWQQETDEKIRLLLRFTAKRIGINKYTAEYYNFAENLLKQFYISNAAIKNDDSSVIKINLKNGTFVFGVQNKLLSFNKEDFITYQLPFEYNPNATAPLFEQYLNQVLPDVDCQNILAEYLGYVFTKGHKQEKCLLLYGGGANGKSVFFNIVSALLGKENTTNYSLRNLGNDNTRAMIENKLLNYSSEIDAGINKDVFKQLVTGEALQARRLYKDVYLIYNYAKLLFNCNELPKDAEHTDAYYRRFLIIPFKQTIPPHLQDKDLANKIIATELSGVFNWVLQGLERLVQQGSFTNSQLADNTLQEFKQETDSVYQFVRHFGFVPAEKCSKHLTDMYKDFTKYCLDNGFKTPNIGNFRKRLELHHFKTNRRNFGVCVCAEKPVLFDDDFDEEIESPFG